MIIYEHGLLSRKREVRLCLAGAVRGTERLHPRWGKLVPSGRGSDCKDKFGTTAQDQGAKKVPRIGIEPMTRGFSVRCSTD